MHMNAHVLYALMAFSFVRFTPGRVLGLKRREHGLIECRSSSTVEEALYFGRTVVESCLSQNDHRVYLAACLVPTSNVYPARS